MVDKIRKQRVANRIREEIAEILLFESVDPRLSGITVTDVEVDRELEYATIFVSAIEGSERAKEVIEGLEHAQGFLRSELAARISLRSTPRLRFKWDPTFERAEAMERLFNTLEEEEKSRRQGEADATKSDPATQPDEGDIQRHAGDLEEDE